MAVKLRAPEGGEIVWDAGEANEKQKLFYMSRALYTAYGGAKGGGKTHAVRIKAVGGALMNPGIRILIMRRTYTELEENHIRPVLRMVPPGITSYNGTNHVLLFRNGPDGTDGSTIKFGHWQEGVSENEYNGLEYDWIFIDEATQFTERAFNFLGGCLRGVNGFPKRMYLTCNPGGVGHAWVKRLFIDRAFRQCSENPEENENPQDYLFIPATVEDNTFLMNSSPGYLRMLANMPEDKRRAYRYGDWNAVGGNYFPEFSPRTHTVPPFKIPAHWSRSRSMDYGLDMLAVLWWATDEDGRAWCVREVRAKNKIVSAAAEEILAMTPPGEDWGPVRAPPDLWSRQKDSGRTMAELFAQYGVPLIKADNSRVQGHMLIKDALALRPVNDGYVRELFGCGTLPGMMFFDTLKGVTGDLTDIQADEDNPDDCAVTPHELTHSVDAVRYFCVSRQLPAGIGPDPESAQREEEYEEYRDYLLYGG